MLCIDAVNREITFAALYAERIYASFVALRPMMECAANRHRKSERLYVIDTSECLAVST